MPFPFGAGVIFPEHKEVLHDRIGVGFQIFFIECVCVVVLEVIRQSGGVAHRPFMGAAAEDSIFRTHGESPFF